MIKWKILDEEYTDFLRNNYEPRIPYTDYGKDKYKPFFGELFRVGRLVYVTQVTSPKPRHYKMKNSLDFQKIYIDGRLISCVNLNYMFPVPDKELSDLEYSEIDSFVRFASEKDKSKYIRLLQYELQEINKLPIERNAQILYKRKYEKPDDYISKRCFDFLYLEQCAQKWTENSPDTDEKIPVGSSK
ncbi:MAG: type III toxin-antitoxin system ToxN/AbiQ family toxin [Oscillospiraceae bacterium]|nr:type III toxin-antitoxin system ToxN/AbiQ family toxin [Oscillospiraceae bacterium]